MNTKHIAKIIKTQVNAVKETQDAFKAASVAFEAINNALAKQRSSLDELAEAFELEGASATDIRLRAMTKAGEKK